MAEIVGLRHDTMSNSRVLSCWTCMVDVEGKAMLRIGVTGTNGKSTTCTWLEAVLGAGGAPVACVRNTGYTLSGRPVQATQSLAGFLGFERWVERAGAVALIVEVTSRALVNGFAAAWSCDVAVLTNITRDHLDLHGSMDAYVAAKSLLFATIKPGGTAVLNGSDPSWTAIAQAVAPGVEVQMYELEGGAASTSGAVMGRVRYMAWERTDVELMAPSPGGPVLTVPAPGLHFAENALAAWVATAAAEMRPEAFVDALAGAARPAGRLDIVAHAPTIIVDYAHSPDALQRTLATVKQLTRGNVTAVFGAGGDTDVGKRPPMGHAAAVADTIVLTSDNPRSEDPADIARQIESGIDERESRDVWTILDRREAIYAAVAHAGPDDAVLIAGRGDERHQSVGKQRVPLHDRSVALQALTRAQYHDD